LGSYVDATCSFEKQNKKEPQAPGVFVDVSPQFHFNSHHAHPASPDTQTALPDTRVSYLTNPKLLRQQAFWQPIERLGQWALDPEIERPNPD